MSGHANSSPSLGSSPEKVSRNTRYDGLAMSIDAAAEFIGCTPRALRSMAERQIVPFRRRGFRLLFLRSELEQWLDKLPGVSLNQAIKNRQQRR